MIEKIKSSIGFKLLLLLTIVIILAIVPLTFTALRSLKHYGQIADELHEEQIRLQALSGLTKITSEQAGRYQEYFNRIAASAALLGSQASAIYADLPIYSAIPLQKYSYKLSKKNNTWRNDSVDPVVTLYWGETDIPAKVSEEMRAMTHLTPLFKRVLRENPEAHAVHTIFISGMGHYFTNNGRSKKAAFDILPTTVFDLRHGEPMTIFGRKKQEKYDVKWTDIYKDIVTNDYMLTASAPIYDDNDVFRGITGIDIPLSTIISEVYAYDKIPSKDLILFSFILNEDGRIVAMPQKFAQLLGITFDHPDFANTGDRLNTYLWESRHKSVQEMVYTAKRLINYSGKLSIDSKNYYIATSKMPKQGWFFGIAVLEEDMLLSVAESRQELSKTIKSMAAKGVFISLFTVFIAVFIIFTFLKYLITPLRKLALATTQVAAGDLTVRSPVTSNDEVGVLARSFNSMVTQLEAVQMQQEQHSNSLKLEVEQRNAELFRQKKDLEKIITQLKREIEHRQIISEALRHSQKMYIDTLESSNAGVYIVEDGIISYVNTSLAENLFRSSKEELVGKSPLELFCEEERPLAAENIQQRLKGVDIPPYTIKCLRPDGSSFPGEIWSRVSAWQHKKVLVGTISDISDIKKNEERLQIQDRQLQQSLREKEVLLKEIYHRTKNNMLIIISMLDLQSEDFEDEGLKTIFQETENRIRSMALVHEKLYQSQNLAEIDMGSYLHDVAESLLTSMVLDNRIKLKIDAEPILINIDYAVPLGLVVNEIITNSIKHAFPNKMPGSIFLSIEKSGCKELLLTIADNGIGLPEEVDVLGSTTFGMGIIISSLVKMQLKGQITVERSQGTRYQISFPEPKIVQRL